MSAESTAKARMLAGSDDEKIQLFIQLIDKVVAREVLSDDEIAYLEFLKSYFMVIE